MAYIGASPPATALTASDIADGIISEAKMANDAISLTELKAGTDGEVISWDASGNPVAIAVGTSGHFLKSQGAGSQPVFAAAGGGKILQTVGTTKTDTGSWTAHATAVVETGLQCAITCAATSSKVIVMWQVNIGYQGAITQDMIHLTRNDTEVNQGDAASSRKRANAFWGGSHSSNKLNYMSNTYSGMFLDSPSSTSELTYKVEHTDATAAGTYYINRTDRDNDAAGYDPRTVSNMILMEVGA